MPTPQKCPHCKRETKKPYDEFLGRYTSRKQCPQCGAQYNRDKIDRRIKIYHCEFCSYQFNKTELARIRSGDLEACPICKSLIKRVETVLVADPDQAELPGVEVGAPT